MPKSKKVANHEMQKENGRPSMDWIPPPAAIYKESVLEQANNYLLSVNSNLQASQINDLILGLDTFSITPDVLVKFLMDVLDQGTLNDAPAIVVRCILHGFLYANLLQNISELPDRYYGPNVYPKLGYWATHPIIYIINAFPTAGSILFALMQTYVNAIPWERILTFPFLRALCDPVALTRLHENGSHRPRKYVCKWATGNSPSPALNGQRSFDSYQIAHAFFEFVLDIADKDEHLYDSDLFGTTLCHLMMAYVSSVDRQKKAQTMLGKQNELQLCFVADVRQDYAEILYGFMLEHVFAPRIYPRGRLYVDDLDVERLAAWIDRIDQKQNYPHLNGLLQKVKEWRQKTTEYCDLLRLYLEINLCEIQLKQQKFLTIILGYALPHSKISDQGMWQIHGCSI